MNFELTLILFKSSVYIPVYFQNLCFLASLVWMFLSCFSKCHGCVFWFVLGWDKGCSGFTEDKYHNSWSCGSIDKRRHPNCEWLVYLFYFFVCKREHWQKK